ncbi:major facilitator superfamily domain-containing protein [Irpex lacteus]|nr:major facilitator superfamily domain-containing protein [Irpex lacteus]
MSASDALNTPMVSPARTLVDGTAPQKYSAARRYTLLIIFCLAQFLDAMNNGTLFSAIPTLVAELDMTSNESTWLISGFQLTFASFLLISGRISDVYNPSMYITLILPTGLSVMLLELSFTTGMMVLGLLSLGAGFADNKIALIVLRALSGIAAALTIPSALALLTDAFPQKKEQARAIGAFGGCGAVGNVLGLIVGAIFVEYATWPWIFWFVAIAGLLISLAGAILIPGGFMPATPGISGKPRWMSLDLGGVSILTAALILFIFAVTSGGASTGWRTAGVIAPLIISVFMVIAFFYYETRIPVETASVPPGTWFLPNFGSLFGVALLPQLWWTADFTILTPVWQDVYKWSAISVALRMIPISGISLIVSFSERSRTSFPLNTYSYSRICWFIFGSAGAMGMYTHAYIAIFRCVPTSMAGTVGAIFNCALQLGGAVGIAAVSSIESSLEAGLPRNSEGVVTSYKGRAAGFWFLLAIIGVEMLNVSVFYRVEKIPKEDVESQGEVSEKRRADNS